MQRWDITIVRRPESIDTDPTAQFLTGCAVYFYFERGVVRSNDLCMMGV
jgi:hypothetical protein